MRLLTSPCCDPCDCCGPAPKADATSLLKFSGNIAITAALLTPQVNYLGDAGSVTVGAAPVLYPVSRRGRLKNLAVNIQSSGSTPVAVLPATSSILVELLRNGTAVEGASVLWSAGDPLGITKSIRTRRIRIHRDDVISLRVTSLNLVPTTTGLGVGATISLGEELGREGRRDRDHRRF